jgi:hypothetical protein
MVIWILDWPSPTGLHCRRWAMAQPALAISAHVPGEAVVTGTVGLVLALAVAQTGSETLSHSGTV